MSAVGGTRRGLRDDDDGAMLLLAGMLLVLGFVTIGTTLVQIESLEPETARLQRDSTVQDFRIVVADLNESISGKLRLGEKDVDKFMVDSNVTLDAIKRVATRKGFYLDARLAEDALGDIYATPSRCPTATENDFDRGVIIAYDRGSTLKTIVGAVFDIYLTNGRESIEYRYYIKVYDCLERDTYNYFHRATDIEGSVTGEDDASAPDGGDPLADDTDGDQSMTLEEATSAPGSGIEHLEPLAASPQWGPDAQNIFVSDDLWAEDDQPNNRIEVTQLDTTGLPEAGLIEGPVTVNLEQHVSLATGQFQVYLKDELGNESAGATQFGSLLLDGVIAWTFATNPAGQPWQLADFEDLEVWIYSRKEAGLNPTWYVDYMNVTATIIPTPEQSGNYEIEWDFIPFLAGDPFATHEIQLRYLSDDEAWTVEVWDNVAEAWNVRGTLAETTGTYAPWTYDLTAAEMEGGYPKVRFTDSAQYAADPATLDLDYVRILSQVPPV